VIHQVGKLKLAASTQGYPFWTSWQLRIEGEQHLRDGLYHTSAILLGSAFEARANELLRYFYWKEGKSTQELEATFTNVPFVSRLKTEYHPRIGGNFDVAKPGPLRHWMNKGHWLRNRVVHGGYRPDREETVHASVAMAQAWDYLMSLVRAKIKSFPELSPFVQLGGDQFFWPPRSPSPERHPLDAASG
jgi:hypothetical protein